MKVLVACEESQAVCIAFRKRGHEAYSCDLQECSGVHPEWHIKDDVSKHLNDGWNLIIAHPPCTRLANSGVRWLAERNLWHEMNEAAAFFKMFFYFNYRTGIPVAIENPIPHKYAMLPKYSQIIQPWQFGHPESKATCLWLYNLPKLQPTNIVKPEKQSCWRMAPGPERSKLRSKTFPGIAKAMAEQWG
ncbi:MAG: hypothetical protein ABSA76_02325 [Bacteroidales bacterium]